MGKVELWWTVRGMIVLLLLLIPGVLGWGKEGHYAICKIAEVNIASISQIIMGSSILGHLFC